MPPSIFTAGARRKALCPQLYWGLALALLLAAAFALRLVTHGELTRGGSRLLSPDDYGHLRRAAATVREFPRVPYVDSYLSHPHGGRWIWPPFFELAIATPSRLLDGRDAPLESITRVAAWLPPVLGALALLPLFALGRRLRGGRTAFAAAATYAVLPAAIVWSAYGHADQHVGEALAFLAFLAALARWLEGGEDDRLAGAWLAGALAAMVLVWQGGVFGAPLLALSALLARKGRSGSDVLLVAALLVLPWAWIAGGPTTYISFGRFQPLFLALAAALLWLASFGRWGIGAAAVAGLAIALNWPPIAGALAHLVSATQGTTSNGAYLAYPREWLALIGEYRPLLDRGVMPVVGQLSAGVLCLPLAWMLWLQEVRREPARRGALLALLVASPAVLAMALAQRRYVYYLAPLVAIALADVAALVATRSRVAAAALVLLLLAPAIPAIGELRRAPGAPGADLLATLARLGELDPPPRDPLRPEETRPGEVEGVMAPWSIGHLVTLYARRPVVADNFGYGFLEQAKFFTTPPEDDAAALQQLIALRCRYVLVTDLAPVLSAYAAAADRTGIARDDMLATRLARAADERPVPFLRRVLTSESLAADPGGDHHPRFQIYRVEEPGSPSG